MPQYKPYPNEKNTPSRKSRKGSRRSVFLFNKVANRLLIKSRKEVRDARLAEAEGTEE